MTHSTSSETHRPPSPADARPPITVAGHPLWFCLFCVGSVAFVIGLAGGILVSGGHRSRPERPAEDGQVARLVPGNPLVVAAYTAEHKDLLDDLAESRDCPALRPGRSFVLDAPVTLKGRGTLEGWVATGSPEILCPSGSRVMILDVLPPHTVFEVMPCQMLAHVLVDLPDERTPMLGWMAASLLEEQVLRSLR